LEDIDDTVFKKALKNAGFTAQEINTLTNTSLKDLKAAFIAHIGEAS